jgi:hypothetical protein
MAGFSPGHRLIHAQLESLFTVLQNPGHVRRECGMNSHYRHGPSIAGSYGLSCPSGMTRLLVKGTPFGVVQ